VKRPAVRALIACGLLAGLLAGRPVAAAPATTAPGAPKPPRITVSADVMSIDAVTRVVMATGRVRITDGVTTATAGRAMLYHSEGRGVLTGHSRVGGPQGVLEATEITIAYTAKAITRIVARGQASLDGATGLLSASTLVISPATDTVTAEEGVRFFTPPDVVATGSRLTYQRSRGLVVLEGAARVQNADGFIEGERIDAHERGQRATVTGDVVGRFRDIEIKSRTADLFGLEKKAIFLGDVQVTQPGRSLFTEKVTVWYAAGRIVAEGQTRVRLEAPP
jgi:lipopolysaccharide export system protein LptA